MSNATAQTKEEKKELIGFFKQEDKTLEKALTKKELNLDHYSSEDLKATNEKGSLKVKIPQFIACTALITKSVSLRTKAIFYNCDIYVLSPYHHKLSSTLFTELEYTQLCLDNNLDLKVSEIQLPVRVRFVKGYSNESLSTDKSFYAFDVLFPGNEKKLFIRDFLKGGEMHLINLLSKKNYQECLAQQIGCFNDRGFKLYLLDSTEINAINKNKDFWDLYSDDLD